MPVFVFDSFFLKRTIKCLDVHAQARYEISVGKLLLTTHCFTNLPEIKTDVHAPGLPNLSRALLFSNEVATFFKLVFMTSFHDI